MKKEILNIATCQFAVSADVGANAEAVCRLMETAAKDKADVAHFSECALSGYAGADFASFDDFDWELLRQKTLEIMALAKKLHLWVVLGSTHRLTEPHKPHNCLYLINPHGKIADRYDKRFCTEGDLTFYTPGNHFVMFELGGVKCALLICFDLRFPEIYRALCKEGVQCIFQSFYNSRQMGPSIHTHIMRQTMQANAASNYFRVSMANSCGWFCPYPSCFIQPDGEITSQMEDHKEGLILNRVDLSQTFYDPSAPFRNMAIRGLLTNGSEQVSDIRSQNRTCL
jgi:predicted amidohydrolase